MKSIESTYYKADPEQVCVNCFGTWVAWQEESYMNWKFNTYGGQEGVHLAFDFHPLNVPDNAIIGRWESSDWRCS
jgi:hypothetical protein